MFTITERDRQLAQQRGELDQALKKEFGDIVLKGHPMLTAKAAEFILGSSLEQVLEERTKLLRLRYCNGVSSQHGVHVLVTKQSLYAAYVELLGGQSETMTRKAIRILLRKFVSGDIKIGEISGPLQYGDSAAGRLALPDHDYYSFYLSY